MTAGWSRRAVVGVAVLGLGLGVGACSAGPASTTQTQSPFRACPEGAAAPPTTSGPAASNTSGPATAPVPVAVDATAGRALPDVALPCFTGGAPVRLARLGVPAVINFWSSTCAPCRRELPQLQRFADATSGRLAVVGVVTADRRDSAASAGVDFGVTFPSVFDPDRTLLSAWGRTVLPVTLFVDAGGTVRHEDLSGALTLSTVDQLSRRYLGVGG